MIMRAGGVKMKERGVKPKVRGAKKRERRRKQKVATSLEEENLARLTR